MANFPLYTTISKADIVARKLTIWEYTFVADLALNMPIVFVVVVVYNDKTKLFTFLFLESQWHSYFYK